ncbi:hypothetical protein MMC21_007433 [Puttea exsequens]|nr:hypothetical protein [Puttea exsequens]
MHSSDDVNPNPEKRARWKKCPICWDSIYISETRPVRWFTGQERERPQEGGDVVLRLIMRQPGSTLALPRNGAEAVEIPDEIPWYLAAEVMDYARVMKGSEEYMTEQYGAEIEELLQQEKEDELMFGDETIWTKKAVASIRDAKERVKGIGSPPKAPQQPSERKARWPTIEHRGGAEDVPEFYHIQHASKSGHCLDRIATKIDSSSSESSLDQMTCGNSTSPSDASSFRTTASTATNAKPEPSVQCWAAHSTQQSISRHRERSSAGGNPDSPFFFYEALLHYYLSPLDIRILKAAFGNFSSFPTTILPRVEHVSTGRIVDDELRRRARYLAHLPAGCEVGFLECDWTDVVPPEVLATFTAEIERRRKKNFEKETREEKERVRAEREEDDKRWAAARRRRPTPAQEVISETDFQPLNENSTVDFAASSPPWSSQGMQGGVGFESLASPSTSPSTARTVWGTRIVVPSSPHLPAAQDEDDVPGDDGWLQNWEQDLLREENLVAQVEATSLNASSSKQGAPTGNGKKKKGKRITLMSTNVRRGT